MAAVEESHATSSRGARPGPLRFGGCGSEWQGQRVEAPEGAGGEKAVEGGSHRGGFGVYREHVGWTVGDGRSSESA